jgi:hypothetical protein
MESTTIYTVKWYGGQEYFECKADAAKFSVAKDREIMGVGEQCRLFSIEVRDCSHDCDMG